jgi:hypothetical protein
MTKLHIEEYKGYSIIYNHYRGYDAVYRLNTFITLTTEPKQWIDLQIEYFNHRAYTTIANEQ